MAKPMSRKAPILKEYDSLQKLLLDKDLAALGDSYINFVYSLAVSKKTGHPTGAKVNNRILADAVEKSGLRKLLPHRVDKHARGNAAEALMVFAWLQDMQELSDAIKVINEQDDPAKAFANLLRDALEKVGAKDDRK
jgi:hypothetical protein